VYRRIANIKARACRTLFPELIPSNGKPEAIGPDSQFLAENSAIIKVTFHKRIRCDLLVGIQEVSG